MSLLPRLSVLLAAVITPCLSKITNVEFRNDSRPSVPLARPFAFADAGPDAETVVVMSIADAEVTWKPDIPEESQDYHCFRLCMVSDGDYLMRMDARGVDSICKSRPAYPFFSPWQDLPDWAVIFLTFDDAVYYIYDVDTKKDLKELSPSVSRTVQGGYNYEFGVWYTPYFINCCPDLATVSFETEVELSTVVRAHKIYLPMGEAELPTLYRVRLFHPSTVHLHPVGSLPMFNPFWTLLSSCTISSDLWSHSIIVWTSVVQNCCPAPFISTEMPGVVPDRYTIQRFKKT